MEHIEDDSLDNDALSRLGVEEYTEAAPSVHPTWEPNTRDNVGIHDAPDGVAFNSNNAFISGESDLTVQGDMAVQGDMNIGGVINNDTISDTQTVLIDAQRRIHDLQSEIIAERAERYCLEDRVKALEDTLESSHLTPKRN